MSFIKDIIRDLARRIMDLILANTRVVMAVVLVICVSATIIIAINARGRVGMAAADEDVGEPGTTTEGEENDFDPLDIPELPMELNKYPEVNRLITDYYQALTKGDSTAASLFRVDLDELDKIRIEEMAKYIIAYEDIEVYTKPGLTEGSFMVYICHNARLREIDVLVPGMMTYYVMPDEDGRLVIRIMDVDDDVREYISVLNFQDNLVDLYNRVQAEFNDLLVNNIEVDEYLEYMKRRLSEDVGIILAQMRQPDISVDIFRDDPDRNSDNGNNGNVHAPTDVMWLARTTTVVNIRSSDSENAERIDRAIAGQEFTVLEQKLNGWSRIRYQRGEAFIKSEFLEIISEIGGAPQSASSVTTTGRVRVTSNGVRVRSSPNTNSDVLGSVQNGSRLDMVEQMTNGWTQVVYDNQVGYIRSDLVAVE
ncbi:MAG: SH3 domain-containing protein [Lachnospiraceae bacterium]|jgi:hypothetical protein|nr:SH3 domain-containing protein [Lachnospiraceae bacterium]